jgi:hypothetical protein
MKGDRVDTIVDKGTNSFGTPWPFLANALFRSEFPSKILRTFHLEKIKMFILKYPNRLFYN